MLDPFYPPNDQGLTSTGERRLMGARRRDSIAIVGESDHQEALRDLLDKHGPSTFASLKPDPGHHEDPHAVAVVIDERMVGYLSPEVAKKYGAVIGVMAPPPKCQADLHGGEWDMPHITVVLDFSEIYAAARRT
jgi:hypothetical protein